ncbi:MAG: DNA alkylation repair protein [Meiothermus sp.]
MSPEQFVAELKKTLEAHRNPAQAAPMAKHMKGQFPFLGLKRPEHQALAKPLLAQIRGKMDERWLRQAVRSLWALPEREFQYTAYELLWANRNALTPSSLALAKKLLTQKPLWDSVDALSGSLVGPLVLRFPKLKTEMDRFARHPNFWLRRRALIHQLGYKHHTDAEQLFRYCLDNAADGEFFIRKGMGWALREYAKTDWDAVYGFVEQHKDKLSAFTLHEALKHKKGAEAV